jgi:mono/diheme cytochrome c family protein
VSPINPRLILLANASFLAFNRGVQQVELAIRSREDYGLDFYLVTFEQACNASPAGCRPGDLYTPRIESDWSNVRIADDEDLENTPSDCRQCHARGRDKPIALMRELDGPWTHFFMTGAAQDYDFPEPNGVDLIQDYLAAKGDEPYGGMPKQALSFTVGLMLQTSVGSQPLIFDGQRIMNERWPWSPDAGYRATPSRSATWDRGFAAFKRGDQLAQPHHDPRVADPTNQASLTSAYQKYRDGTLAADDLPDLGDVFPDDPETRAEIGLETEPGATPAEALVQACAQCHNDVLDQSISRARFNVDLSRMSAAEIGVALERLSMPRDADGAMPPSGFRQIYEPKRAELLEYLRAGVRTSVDDELLGHAASVGMNAVQPGDQRPGL